MPTLLDFLSTLDAHWAVEPAFAQRAEEALKSLDYGAHAAEFAAQMEATGTRQKEADADEKPYEMVGDVAVLPLIGPMTKRPQSWGDGTSTVRYRRLLRQAAQDKDVKAIVLLIDSPGGQVSGTADLANDVAALRSKKPIVAYIEDMGASAAYWVASQAEAIYCNETAEVGSIGVITRLVDSSRAVGNSGLAVHWIKSGAKKAVGASGAPVSASDVETVQAEVDAIAQMFQGAVARGRGLSEKQVEAICDAGVYVGPAAKEKRLVDGIASLESVISRLGRQGPGKLNKQSAAASSSPAGGKGSNKDRARLTRAQKDIPNMTFTERLKGLFRSAGVDEEEIEAALTSEPLPVAGKLEPLQIPVAQAPEFKALQTTIEAQSQQIAALVEQNKTLSETIATESKARQDAEAKARLEKNHAEIGALVRQMRLTPANAESWKTLAETNPAAFEAALPALQTAPVIREVARQAVSAEPQLTSGDPGERLAAMAKAYAAEHKVSLGTALKAVSAANPQLAQAHKENVAQGAREGSR